MQPSSEITQPTTGGERKKPSKIIGFVVWIVLLVLLAGGAFYFSNHYLVRWPIDGESMSPTLSNQDNVLLFKTQNVKRGDVIIFLHTPANKYFVKRVIGVGGDVITSVYDEEKLCFHVYRNGEPVDESTIKEPMYASGSWKEATWTVPEGKYYVLGDNRNHSNDSQDGYFVDKSEICGIVFMKVKPTLKIIK